MSHNIIINAKTMYDLYMHEGEHTGNRFLISLFARLLSTEIYKAHAEHYAHIIPMAMVADMRNGIDCTEWSTFHMHAVGVYVYVCVCIGMKNFRPRWSFLFELNCVRNGNNFEMKMGSDATV